MKILYPYKNNEEFNIEVNHGKTCVVIYKIISNPTGNKKIKIKIEINFFSIFLKEGVAIVTHVTITFQLKRY